MASLAETQSQKAMVALGFHKDLANHFVRPDFVNMLGMRSYVGNEIYTKLWRIRSDTTPVKTYPANEWEFYNIAGNVEEWCMDYYHPDFSYLGLNRISASSLSEKTVKGGCWNKGVELLACRARRGKWYKIGTVGIGFRIVWDLTDGKGGDEDWLHV